MTQVHVLGEVVSTNDELRRLAERGAPAGTVVLAESQTGGRGRRGRGWYSPAGDGLYISVLLRPRNEGHPATRWTLAAGLAAYRARRALGAAGASVKWPNDVLANRRKLAGTLAELRWSDGRPELVIGTGFNVRQGPRDFPGALSERATSLRQCVDGPTPEREALAAHYLAVLFEIAERLELGDWDPVRLEWERSAPESRSRPVRVTGADGASWVGVTRGIDRSGALRVERADGETVSIHHVDSVRAVEE